MAERYVKMHGKTFLYQQKAPFVQSGMSVRGAIEYDAEEDKLRCHECGQWRRGLNAHAFIAHGITAGEYKQRHGLSQKASLINEAIRIKRSADVKRRVAADPSKYQFLKDTNQTFTRRHRNEGVSMETRNERRKCPAQLLYDIAAVGERLGRRPTAQDLREAKISPNSAYLSLNVQDLASLVSLAGFAPGQRKARTYFDGELIEMLRDFWARHGRLPTNSDFNRGLLPARATFIRHFGSMAKAYEAAGLGNVRRREVA